jgi:hypothetical protein
LSALDLLSGDAQTFRAKVWASRVHLHQTDPDLLVGLLSLDDVDRLLTSSAIRTPAVRLAQDGAVLPASRFTRSATQAGQPMTGLLDARKVLDLFAQGVAVHSDSHDVFVFQTHGTKLWEVHEDGERREVLLEPGLSMYLPTGTPHAARAQDTASLHVTIGINQLTWRDLVDRVVQAELVGGDDHLPAGYPDDPALLADGLSARLERLAQALRSVDVDAAAAEQVRRFTTGRPSRLRGGLRDRLLLDAIDDNTPLRRRPGHPVRLATADDGRIDVLLGDRTVTFPGWVRPALEALGDLPDLVPADLADLDPQSRVVLCRRLVREGLLEVVG